MKTTMRELYHDLFIAHVKGWKNFRLRWKSPITRLTRFHLSGTISPMPSSPDLVRDTPRIELPERLCTWCKVLMRKRLVGGNQFIHYTCPKCVFQHTRRLGPKP